MVELNFERVLKQSFSHGIVFTECKKYSWLPFWAPDIDRGQLRSGYQGWAWWKIPVIPSEREAHGLSATWEKMQDPA
jgi:hypothetical protein